MGIGAWWAEVYGFAELDMTETEHMEDSLHILTS